MGVYRAVFITLSLFFLTTCTAEGQGSLVAEALFAQVDGLGGCARIGVPTPTSIEFFPDVRFYDARCIAEHGDMRGGLVAVDLEGQLFLLDSESGFDFLIARHPAVGVAEAPVTYAAWALRMSGARGWNENVVTEHTPIPADVEVAVVAGELSLPAPVVTLRRPNVIDITVAVLGPFQVRQFQVSIALPSGKSVVLDTTRLWSRRD